MGPAHLGQRRVHVRLHRHDPAAVHKLQAQVRGAPTVEGVHVQGFQHVHRRRIRVRNRHAHHTQAGVPEGRPGVLRVPVPEVAVPGG